MSDQTARPWCLTLILLMLVGCASDSPVVPSTAPPQNKNEKTTLPLEHQIERKHALASISEDAYAQIEQRIRDRIEKLNIPDEYRVIWVLDDPNEPHSKTNARRAVYGKNGYWFYVTFYRGQWGGAAKFTPIAFGDLKVWFNSGYDHQSGPPPEIRAVDKILSEEHQAFMDRYAF